MAEEEAAKKADEEKEKEKNKTENKDQEQQMEVFRIEPRHKKTCLCHMRTTSV